MGWMYMVVCFMDMVIFPIAWSVLQTVTHQTITQWNPLTLQGAGLFHIAMGAVLGIAAYGRTQEKLGGANNGGLQSTTTQPTTSSVSTPVVNTFNSNPSAGTGAPGFGSSSSAPSSSAPSSFGSAPPAPAFAAVTTSASGKPGPAQPDHPEI